MRFSRPRAPIFLRDYLTRLREDIRRNPKRYRRFGDYALYAGLVAVLLLSSYVLVFSAR